MEIDSHNHKITKGNVFQVFYQCSAAVQSMTPKKPPFRHNGCHNHAVNTRYLKGAILTQTQPSKLNIVVIKVVSKVVRQI